MKHNKPESRHDAEFERLRKRLRLALGAVVLVTLVGVLGFTLIGGRGHNLIDAIYMTVITLTTVGFGEIIDMSRNPVGRIFTIALLLGGMGIVAYTVPMLAAFVIEGQLHDIFRRRRMENRIAQLAGHYIICGDEETSWFVAEELIHTERTIVLITPTEEVQELALARLGDIPLVMGDPTADEVLARAGIERASGIVFSLENEKDNVLGVLTARRLSPMTRIIASSEHAGTEAKLRMAGADGVVSPSRIGGLRMASELLRPKVVSFLDQMLREKGGSLRVEELEVLAESSAAGKTLAWLGVGDVRGAVLLAVRRPDGPFEFKPPADTTLEPGMSLIVMADAQGRSELEQKVQGRWRLSRS